MGEVTPRRHCPKSVYSWSKEFVEAGKNRLADDTARAATSGEVKDLCREARDLKKVVAEHDRRCGQGTDYGFSGRCHAFC